MYSVRAIEELGCCCCCCGGCGGSGRRVAAGSLGEKVKLPPFSAGTNGAWTVAGSTGCTLGVMGLYAGATGEEEPADFCVVVVSSCGAVGWWGSWWWWWWEGAGWASTADMCERGQCVDVPPERKIATGRSVVRRFSHFVFLQKLPISRSARVCWREKCFRISEHERRLFPVSFPAGTRGEQQQQRQERRDEQCLPLTNDADF